MLSMKVDPNKVNELSAEFSKLSRTIEEGEIEINKDISNLIREINNYYSESYVRSTTGEAQDLLSQIRQLASSITERLSNKSRVLEDAAAIYIKNEKDTTKTSKSSGVISLFIRITKGIAKYIYTPQKSITSTSGNVFNYIFGKGGNAHQEPSINLPLDISALESNLEKNSNVKSEDVVKLQQRLKDLGYDIKVDGYFGDQTLAVVNDYKKKCGILNTGDYEGVVDNQTWLYLFGNLSGELKYDPDKYSEQVRTAQIRLKEKGYDVEITGYFDYKTLKAVNEFKDNNKLGNIGDWEGVIGPQTWGVLFGAGAVAQITAEPQSNIERPDIGTGGGATVTELQQQILDRAKAMIDFKWTPTQTQDFRGWSGTMFPAGVEVQGIPYTQTEYQMDLQGFKNALQSSDFYDANYNPPYDIRKMPKYGNDCSGFVSFAWGLPRMTTYGIMNSPLTKHFPLGFTDLKPGDAFVRGDHTFLYAYTNAEGNYVCYEQTPPKARVSVYTPQSIVKQGYIVYRLVSMDEF